MGGHKLSKKSSPPHDDHGGLPIGRQPGDKLFLWVERNTVPCLQELPCKLLHLAQFDGLTCSFLFPKSCLWTARDGALLSLPTPHQPPAWGQLGAGGSFSYFEWPWCCRKSPACLDSLLHSATCLPQVGRTLTKL